MQVKGGEGGAREVFWRGNADQGGSVRGLLI